MSAHDDLTFDTLDIHATDDLGVRRLQAYADTWSQGFHEGRIDEEKRKRWVEDIRADDAVLRAAWPRTTTVATEPRPVATFTSWTKTINVGGGRMLPLHMITDVTVAPTHRRRGLLTRMVTDDLRDAVARRLPLAALTVSEASIYGRYGFGIATRRRLVEVDLTSRFRLRSEHDGGRLELVSPAEAYPITEEVYAAALASTRGAIARPSFYTTMGNGSYDWEQGGPDRSSQVAVHVDDHGRADGYVRFRVKSGSPGKPGVAQVVDLQALSEATYLRLWRFVAGLDLVTTARAAIRPDDLLDLALVDPRAVATTELRDMIWLRVLDVVAALEARPWRADGTVTLEIDDPLGHAAGRFRVETTDGRARVTPTADAPGVLLGVETLGCLYLGDRTVTDLAAVGRVSGPEVATYAAMADHAGPPPFCTTYF